MKGAASRTSLVCVLGTALVSAFLFVAPAVGFQGAAGKAIGTFLTRVPGCVKCLKLAPNDATIKEWATIAEKPGGTKHLNSELGRLNLPQKVLDDTYARILVAQGRLERDEAEGLMRRLAGVPGFGSALSKSMGANPGGTIGHLNEVRIADNARLQNFEVAGIGVRFRDPNKKGETDIDVLLRRNGRDVAIEAKAYPSTASLPLDTFRADMLTLEEFRKAHPKRNVLPVFWITNRPADDAHWRQLEMAAKRHGVNLLVGEPDMAIHHLPLILAD